MTDRDSAQPNPPAVAKPFKTLAWIPWAISAAVLFLALSGQLLLWSAKSGNAPGKMLFNGAVALLPTLYYGWALNKGNSGSALHSIWTPYFLFILTLAGVQISGSLASPWVGAYLLLTATATRYGSLRRGALLAFIICVVEGWVFRQDLKSSSPHLLDSAAWTLVLPWVGLALGRQGAGHGVNVISPERSGRVVANDEISDLSDLLPSQDLPSIDPKELLERSLADMISLAWHAHPAWNAIVLMWKEGDKLVLRQARNRQGQLKSSVLIESGEGVIGLKLREPKAFREGELGPSTASTLPYYEGESPAKALLIQPFFDEGQLLGLLVIDRAEVGAWTPDEENAADMLGKQVVQQAQQAAFFSKVQARGRQVSALYHVTRELGHDLNRARLLDSFPALLEGLVPFDSFYLAMRDGDEGQFKLAAQRGYAPDYASAFQLQEHTVLGGWVLDSGEPVVFNALNSEASIPRFLSEGLDQAAGAYLLVPLILSGKVIGLLKLDRRERPFSQQDKEVALIFAASAAVTLEHSRLYSLHLKNATTDGLTGLYNHRYFQETLSELLDEADKNNKPLALFLTDIDHFKKFNDTFGHQEGDNVLKKTARTVEAAVRQGQDIVCRYGGEEFVVILPNCDVIEAREVAERVRHTCATSLTGGSGEQATPITMSIGICVYPLGAKDQRDLIHLADEALYKAKKTGRNKVCSYKDLP